LLPWRNSIRLKLTAFVAVLLTVVVVAMSAAANFSGWTVGLGLLLLVAGVASAHAFSRRFLRPIIDLADRATKLAPGDFSTRVDVTSDDEMGSLQTAFNGMVAKLAESYAELESRIARRTDEAERERTLLRALMEHHPDVIYFKDNLSRFVKISRALAERLNLDDPADAEGKTDADFFPAAYAAQAHEDEQRLLRSGRPLIGKEEHPTWPDGSETWVSSTKSVLRDSQGEVIGTFGISHDITEQKRAQELLQENERRTRLIVDTAHDAFVAMDAEGKIIDWNPRAEATFGWRREEVVGQVLAETIIPPRYRHAHVFGLRNFLATGEGPVLNQRIEVSALHRDGREFPVELTIAPLRLGDTWVFNAFVHDITQRKRNEEALRSAKEAAEAANRAKGVFLATMSHEIRTPMNAILGLTELVLDTPLSPEQRDYLKLVYDSGESLLAVINDVLDFAKIEAGHFDLDCAPFDLQESVGDTMKTLAMRAHAKGLELTYHIAPDVPEALIGDRGRLRQVIVNLIANAIKFTHQGEVVLTVRCESRDDEAATLHFAVRDTGIGIPEDRRQTIFEAFQQVDSSTTRQFGGTGLGLAISSKLVELMGGRVWLESELGRGSTFHFTVRLAIAKNGLPAASTQPAICLRGLRVLVVDDNATNRRILVDVLRNWDMEPTAVGSAAEAMQALRAAHRDGTPYELVLTDGHMPDTDGFELCRQIKADRELGSAVIMMLTSLDSPGGARRCEELGIAAALMKPIKQSELFDAIVAALGVTTPADESQPARPGRAVRCLRILLAEDSLVNQKLAVGLLEKYGHTVIVAQNGREAIAAVQAHHFDVVLMDVQMPELDGLQATQAIREREAKTGGHVPIVAMTAHAMKGDRERCLEAGMDDYVAKPIRSQELFDAIERVVAKGVRRPESSSNSNHVSSKASIVDWTEALNSVNGDPLFLKELIEAFLQEYPKHLAEIHQALADGDAATLRRAAHTIKGSARYFGAHETHQRAERLEMIGKSGDLTDAPAALAELEEALDRLRPALVTFLQEGNNKT
jgi:two-component system sensor histidine kinase/response regulator